MIEISLSLTAADAKEKKIKGSRTVVIDVLRATSVIITALQNGAKWVLPVSEIEEAWEEKEKHTDALLGGERDAVKIKGFDNGNSPYDYGQEKVKNKGIILSTTNGTRALAKTHEAKEVLIGAMINITALSNYLSKSDEPIHLLCAGTNGEFSMDDFLCAGAITSQLGGLTETELDDISILAKNTWENAKNDIQGYLSTCKHYNVLKDNGFTRDLAYCLTPDSFTIVPMMDLEDGIIKVAKARGN